MSKSHISKDSRRSQGLLCPAKPVVAEGLSVILSQESGKYLFESITILSLVSKNRPCDVKIVGIWTAKNIMPYNLKILLLEQLWSFTCLL